MQSGKVAQTVVAGVKIEESDQDLLGKLKPRYTAILMAARGQSYEKIALAKNMAVGTVRSRLHRARAALVKLREERDAREDAPAGTVRLTSR